MSARVARKKLHEYDGWPQGIYPMSDGWVPPAYPGEEDLVAYDEKMAGKRKAILVKKHLCVKQPEYEELSQHDVLNKAEFSMYCMPIMEGAFSGLGNDRAWYLIVYYEIVKRSKVEKAFRAAGCVIADYEQVPVDPDEAPEWEKTMMYDHGSSKYKAIVSEHEYFVCERGTAEFDDPWGPKHPDGPMWE
eukprot:CAMPEP_0170257030 /NCGR_PEP_ID=MMETSP0116_2-20130129/28370_1 /TAXON_ID=400756 /ORGANISM="Durinskia baltica, Strain CSIRO CS-38" /LENGTH=188 /DNA_ID=CAMNT_0010508043 /DNA_START=111 /DNA_END=677 /DNA_ORIENTATION=-